MHQHDGANITSSKPPLGQITLKDDQVQLIDHGATILLGTNVTKRGTVSCDSTNHTTRTTGARSSGVGSGPSISYLVPKRVRCDAVISFAFACAIRASRNTRQSPALYPYTSGRGAFARAVE